jgi:hypothetical protein
MAFSGVRQKVKDPWLEYMRTHPCPFKSGEELRERRRQFRRQGGRGDAGVDKPEDFADIELWNKTFAEAQVEREKPLPKELSVMELMDLMEQE